jgi:hypothetical protein
MGVSDNALYEGPQRCGDRLAELRSHRQVTDALRENARLNELGRERALSELPISLPIGGELRHDQAMGLQAECHGLDVTCRVARGSR